MIDCPIYVSEFLQLVGIVMLFTAFGLHEPLGMMEYWGEALNLRYPKVLSPEPADRQIGRKFKMQ
jgi:hypothetical protein